MNQEWCGNELGQRRNEPRLLGMEGMNQDFQEWTRMFRNGPGLSGMNQESSGSRWLSVKFCKFQGPCITPPLRLSRNGAHQPLAENLVGNHIFQYHHLQTLLLDHHLHYIQIPPPLYHHLLVSCLFL